MMPSIMEASSAVAGSGDASAFTDPPVVGLDDPRCREPALVGNKCASLAHLKAKKYNVPGGFCVTVPAVASGVESYRGATVAALRELKPPWVARSSSTVEDSGSLAFPGLFTTLLDLADTRDVLDAIGQIDASTDSAAVSTYAKHHGVNAGTIRMAAIVQSLIPATAAGVAFSVDPVTGAPDIVIEANYGLGETVVDGSITPDSVIVGRDGSIKDKRIGTKREKIVTTTLGTRVRRVETSPLERSTHVLSDEASREIARVTEKIEEDLGVPVDVEWAYVCDELHVLQARPITTLSSNADSGPGDSPRP